MHSPVVLRAARTLHAGHARPASAKPDELKDSGSAYGGFSKLSGPSLIPAGFPEGGFRVGVDPIYARQIPQELPIRVHAESLNSGNPGDLGGSPGISNPPQNGANRKVLSVSTLKEIYKFLRTAGSEIIDGPAEIISKAYSDPIGTIKINKKKLAGFLQSLAANPWTTITQTVANIPVNFVCYFATKPHANVGLMFANASFLVIAPLSGVSIEHTILNKPWVAALVACSQWSLLLTQSLASNGLHRINSFVRDAQKKMRSMEFTDSPVLGLSKEELKKLKEIKKMSHFPSVNLLKYPEDTLRALSRGSFLGSMLTWPYMDATLRAMGTSVGMQDYTGHALSFIATFLWIHFTNKFSQGQFETSLNTGTVSRCITLSKPMVAVAAALDTPATKVSGICKGLANRLCIITDWAGERYNQGSKFAFIAAQIASSKTVSWSILGLTTISLGQILATIPSSYNVFKQFQFPDSLNIACTIASSVLLAASTAAGVSPFWLKSNSSVENTSGLNGSRADAWNFINDFGNKPSEILRNPSEIPTNPSEIFKRGSLLVSMAWWLHAENFLRNTFMSLAQQAGFSENPVLASVAEVQAIIIPFLVTRALITTSRELGKLGDLSESKDDAHQHQQPPRNLIAIALAMKLAEPLYWVLRKVELAIAPLKEVLGNFFSRISLRLSEEGNDSPT